MRTRRAASVLIVVLLLTAGVGWWRVAPGTGGDWSGSLVRARPTCDRLQVLPDLRARAARSGVTSGRPVTVYFEPPGWSGGRLEIARLVKGEWRPESYGDFTGGIVVERLNRLGRKYLQSFWAGGPPDTPLVAVQFPADLPKGRYRACFSAWRGRTSGHVLVPFDVWEDRG